MKHRKTGRQLSRTADQRKALMKTMLGSLVLHERITTTEAKAKEMKNFIDPLVNKAKTARTEEGKKVAVIRDLRKSLPLMAIRKLIGEFGERFSTRGSGYVRITKLQPRKSDSARMAVIEFV
ncbi:MAG: 50S ribosomal protein L17 [Candidatus Moraniibacteriota bacterium]